MPISLNHSTQKELTMVKEIGPSLAKRIIQARPWKSVKDLIQLKGVGQKKLKKISSYLTLDPDSMIYSRINTNQ